MKTKADIASTLATIASIASYDSHLEKYYLVFADNKRGGTYTLMKKEEQWSIHGKGIDYCDKQETFLSEKEVIDFLWKNRTAFRQSLLTLQK